MCAVENNYIPKYAMQGKAPARGHMRVCVGARVRVSEKMGLGGKEWFD